MKYFFILLILVASASAKGQTDTTVIKPAKHKHKFRDIDGCKCPPACIFPGCGAALFRWWSDEKKRYVKEIDETWYSGNMQRKKKD